MSRSGPCWSVRRTVAPGAVAAAADSMTTGPIPIIPNDAGADGHILHSVTLFGEMLRRVGLEIGSGNMLDLVRATDYVSMGKRG